MCKDEVVESGSVGTVGGWVRWWPVLLGVGTMGFVYLADWLGWDWVCQKKYHEAGAIVLLALAVGLFAVRAVIRRNQFHLVMSALCLALFCREWHFAGTSVGIYIALGVIGAWAAARWGRLMADTEGGKIRVWLICTFATYFLSVLISRRVFKHLGLPNEQELHVVLEESVETMAHLMILIGGLVDWPGRGEKLKVKK